MRPAPFASLDAYEREVEAEQAVKPTSLDRRAGTHDRHHRSPGEHVASIEGWRPRTSKEPEEAVTATIHPAGWARACPYCGLIGVVLVTQIIHEGTHEPPPEPPDVRWRCCCGRWVGLP
jgi:hypothetical protein